MKFYLFEQGMPAIHCLVKNVPVEGKPAQLAVDEERRVCIIDR
jgi:hypothetical protein